jgi:HK97 family phage major capsid protein
MNLIEMREKEERLFKELGAVLDGASGRNLTAEESEKVEKMNTEADALQGQIRSAAAVESAEMRLGSARGSWNMTETKVENTPEKDFRGFAAGNYGREFRALPITGGAAPNAAPLADLGLYRQFIEIMDRLAPMRTVCAVDTFSTADIRYPQQATQVTVDDDTAEAAAFDAFEPTFGAKTPTPRKFAVQTSVTQEAVADSLFSLEDIVLRQQAEALAAAQNAAFMLGTGVAAGDDRLFADHSAAGGQLVTAASATAITVKEMVSGLTKLAGTGYFGRPGAFVVSPGVIEDLMANEDGNNRPILQAQANSTYSVESPFQIFGRPVYVASEGNAMTTGKFVASYVASGAARIADVQGINFLRDPYTKSATGEINLLASIRSGFAITEARGIVSYKLG